MNRGAQVLVVVFSVFLLAANPVRAADGELILRFEGNAAWVQVRGEAEDDWRFETSSDMDAWNVEPGFGTLLSGGSAAPWRSLGQITGGSWFIRARRTEGLFDPTLLRIISLTFTQANWQTLLASGRTTGVNVPGDLTMDNGAAVTGMGARYRGNTSCTGMGGSGAPVKKSINLELDFVDPQGELMGYDTVNLNNAYGDETILREALYFNILRRYTVSPAGALAQVYINGANWGVYSFVQQQDGRLIDEFFPGNQGDRWRAPNMAGQPGGPGGGGNSGSSALSYLGTTNIASYQSYYELKSDYHTNAWPNLIHAIFVLNSTALDQLREQAETVLAVDRWLWFLVIENVFADDDSYWNKGADCILYFEPESGRLHPVEHDGNEAFLAGDVQLSPVRGAGDSSRPVLNRLLAIPELRQRYLAHMRTVLREYFNPAVMNPLTESYSALSMAAIAADPVKGYTSMATYTNDLNALKAFVAQRSAFLTNHVELTPLPPVILSVQGPAAAPTAAETAYLTAQVTANGTNGIDSVWLYHRGKAYGRFTAVRMVDDGAHADGISGDGVYGAATTTYPAGTKVRYYVEARSANATKAAAFAPARAEQETYDYRVAVTTTTNTPVVINVSSRNHHRRQWIYPCVGG
jgi:spore coat protein CotH